MRRIVEESLVEIISIALILVSLPFFMLLLKDFIIHFIKILNIGVGI